LTVFGDGKQVRDVLYVDDLIRAYDAFLRDPEDKPAIYNVGGGPQQTTSLIEFLNLLEVKLNKRPEVSFGEWRDGDQRVYVSDITRAREALDWEPTVEFDDGIDRFIAWASESAELGINGE
jgi:CDP-paratose 2-epimerase